MKKLISLFTMLCLAMTMAVAEGSNNPDYFVGEWDLMIEGTPQGDVRVIMVLEKVEGKLKGKFTVAGTDQETTLSSISEGTDSISFSFFAEGYDLYMSLNANGDDAVKGYLVDQFPVSGKRLK
ncbi:hypothetical protein [Mongoliitalea daihaiensis]|uniref:hypothetical protein n=1 Tax=Mongoliitalea daihaiensis TaxID=2782006 RepID=UPI001F1A9B5A|nr:hypothetical protein [Mongoliitalea daihaiensis]UJP66151.1 hypothetical protein IPZ59_05875 [Mongoliitalea daihaiensis]